jgi:hypothetical protein
VATLNCLPQSLCSWDFRILGGPSGPAATAFKFLSADGTISLASLEYQVRRKGWLFGNWTLERDGQTFATGEKGMATFRSFQIRWDAGYLVAKPRSFFTRGYDLWMNDAIVGTILPIHAFTRRAIIECDPAVPELIQLFAFWITARIWRTEARNRHS